MKKGEWLVIGLKETTGSVIEVSCYAGYLITEKSGHNNLKYTTCVSLNNQLPFTPWPLTVHLQVVSLMMHGIVGPPLFHFPCGPRLPHSSSWFKTCKDCAHSASSGPVAGIKDRPAGNDTGKGKVNRCLVPFRHFDSLDAEKVKDLTAFTSSLSVSCGPQKTRRPLLKERLMRGVLGVEKGSVFGNWRMVSFWISSYTLSLFSSQRTPSTGWSLSWHRKDTKPAAMIHLLKRRTPSWVVHWWAVANKNYKTAHPEDSSVGAFPSCCSGSRPLDSTTCGGGGQGVSLTV